MFNNGYFVICVILLKGSISLDIENKLDIIAEKVLSCKAVKGFSVGIVHNGTTLLTKGYGTANIQKNINTTDTTLFGIASLSKAFTATLLAKLLNEHQRFHLDTPVKEILGDDFYFSDPVLTALATVRDLLSHRTGVPQYNKVRLQDNFDREILARKMRFYKRTKGFRSEYLYNNLMYGLLSRITEVVGGDTWENLMKSHIFDPLGMNNTTFTHLTDLDREDMAVPYYQIDKHTWKAVSQRLHSVWGKLGGSGSIVSNAVDMTKWMKFQLSYGRNDQGTQVVHEEVIKETHEGVITMSECKACYYYRKPHSAATFVFDKYALGWRTGYYRGLPIVTHTGSSFSYTAKLTLIPDIDVGIHVSMTGNDGGFEARRALHIYIMDVLMKETPIVTLDNLCYFPYSEPKQDKKNDSQDSHSEFKGKPQHLIGTYGNYGFGKITVLYNSSSNTLQLKYGILGLWDLNYKSGNFIFSGTGIGDVWVLKLRQVIFSKPNHNGEMTTITIPDFERADPPVFEKDLNPSNREKIEHVEVCEVMYRSFSGAIKTNAIKPAMFITSLIILFFGFE